MGEEERRHSPGSTFIHLRKESSSSSTPGLYTVTGGPFSRIGMSPSVLGSRDEPAGSQGAALEPAQGQGLDGGGRSCHPGAGCPGPPQPLRVLPRAHLPQT